MIYCVNCAILSEALENLKKVVTENENKGIKTVIFCEDRLTLAAERTVCAAVGGTFLTSVYTFARFLSSEKGKPEGLLSSQGSAMAVRRIIEEQKDKLTLFKQLSPAASAQAVYDTIALLYSSRVSAEDAEKASARGGILGGKLRDLSVIYSAYGKFLRETGKRDRNEYLRELGGAIENSAKVRGGAVVFLGFQAFTCASAEGVRSAFMSAQNVYGIFIGGAEDIYVNEASSQFLKTAEEFGGAEIISPEPRLIPEAETLRRGLFEPESFYGTGLKTDRVSIFEAADEEEEFEFIAASIKKHVLDGDERYAKISVMLPDTASGERVLARVFSRYKIPYYADRQYSLSEHPLCDFIIDYLLCAVYGCRFSDTDNIIASPFFPAERTEKDDFRNYLLRLADYRGGIKRRPDPEILKNFEFSYETAEKLRQTFLNGLDLIDVKGGIRAICGGIRSLLALFGAEEKLKKTAEEFRDEKPSYAQFCSRAYDAALSVLNEAESISEGASLSEFIKILKSGFSAMKISLIPPKSDAVFVGGLTATANTGSNIVFAAGLTGDVPSSGDDTSLLTDREIAALEEVNLNITPKIRQVNARKRETCALNLCAFRERLYLTYASGADSGDAGVSEIVSYARALFCTLQGVAAAPIDMRKIERSGKAVPYFCSEKLPALKHLSKYRSSREAGAVYAVLCAKGMKKEADAALESVDKHPLSRARQLYLINNSLSPTALETYFACPYLNFIRQGLRVREREEGAVRPVDTGNFIHAVLQDTAPAADAVGSSEEFENLARKTAEDKLGRPPYSALKDTLGGKYAAEELILEAVKISAGMYEQIKNSGFKFHAAEQRCGIQLANGVKISGRIDRIDESGDMVRIIDYKTGTIDSSPAKYYTGAKLQLPLYLLAASEGKRAAGAYYFPASIEYRDKVDGVFRLQGFMDGSAEVVSASDKNVLSGRKSDYVEAYLDGKRTDKAMPKEDFERFLRYSGMIAEAGVNEMLAGNIIPSPAEGTCKYCKAGGSCLLAVGKDGEERKAGSAKCSQIAELVRIKEEGDGTDKTTG